MPFDPKKPFGTICPPTNGCFYYQAGGHYDIDHNMRDFATGEIIEKAPPPKPKAKAVGPDPLPPPKPAGLSMDSFKSQKADAIDLEGWAKGDVKMGFFKVKAEVAKVYGTSPATADEARKLILGG